MCQTLLICLHIYVHLDSIRDGKKKPMICVRSRNRKRKMDNNGETERCNNKFFEALEIWGENTKGWNDEEKETLGTGT